MRGIPRDPWKAKHKAFAPRQGRGEPGSPNHCTGGTRESAQIARRFPAPLPRCEFSISLPDPGVRGVPRPLATFPASRRDAICEGGSAAETSPPQAGLHFPPFGGGAPNANTPGTPISGTGCSVNEATPRPTVKYSALTANMSSRVHTRDLPAVAGFHHETRSASRFLTRFAGFGMTMPPTPDLSPLDPSIPFLSS